MNNSYEVREHLINLPNHVLVDKLMEVYNNLQRVKGNFPFGQPTGMVDVMTIEGMLGAISDRFEGTY